jgi:S-adenosyl-L-homocysteine hydrolase
VRRGNVSNALTAVGPRCHPGKAPKRGAKKCAGHGAVRVEGRCDGPSPPRSARDPVQGRLLLWEVTLCCQDLFYVGQLWSDEPLVPVAADPVTVHRHNIEPQKLNGIEFAVADLSLAESGRHQIRLAEHEMPGLMATRREYAVSKPLAGARMAGSPHMTAQTAVLTM